MSRIWQICIIGGGPAGCAAALAAGLQPDQVLLLEAQSPWREKPCGDAITHSGIAALERLGVNGENPRDLGGKRFAHIDIYARGERFLEFRGDDTTGWMVRRNKLDQLLRDRASRHCTVRYGATACGISTGRPRVLDNARECRRHEPGGAVSLSHNCHGRPQPAVKEAGSFR